MGNYSTRENLKTDFQTTSFENLLEDSTVIRADELNYQTQQKPRYKQLVSRSDNSLSIKY
jgi:hypothetical protein